MRRHVSFVCWLALALVWTAACLPRGHVDLEPRLCASAGDGVGLCSDQRPRLPSAVQLKMPKCINAEMTVTAYRGDRQIDQWNGHVKWTGPIESGGNIYAGVVRRGRIVWVSPPPDLLRFKIQEDGTGGVELEKWLPRGTTRFVVFIRQGYGAGTGTGSGQAGAGAAGHAGGIAGRGGATGHAGGVDGVHGRGAAGHAGRAGGGAGEAGAGSGPGRGRGGGTAAGAGDPCGEVGGGASGHRGGASAADGGVADAWSPTPWGERYGDAEGARGGDGEHGKAGIRGAWALWGGLFGVSRELRAAAEVAVIAADVASPSELVRSAAARVSGRVARESAAQVAAQLRREIAREASKYARAEIKRLRPRIAAEFADRPAAELKRRLRAFHGYKQVQYFAMVEDAAGSHAILRRAVRVKPVDGQLPRNHAYAGEVMRVDARAHPEAARIVREKGRAGVRFTKDGYPVFDPWVYKERGVKADVWITNQRTRREDFRHADAAMRKKLRDPSWKRPRRYTWHHHEDVRTGGSRMLLVPEDLHKAVSHTGGIPHYRVLTGDYDAYQRLHLRRPTRQ